MSTKSGKQGKGGKSGKQGKGKGGKKETIKRRRSLRLKKKHKLIENESRSSSPVTEQTPITKKRKLVKDDEICDNDIDIEDSGKPSPGKSKGQVKKEKKKKICR